MKRFLTLSLAFAAAATFGVASIAQADAPVQVWFHAQNGSGISGSATLVQSGDDVVVVTSTKGGGDLEPIHIHKGTCATLNPAPMYPLTTLHDGDSVSTVKGVKISDLLAGQYAINVHKSTSDIGTYVACADIKASGAMGSHM
jgi:opacity protein-like surface antigen